MKFECFIFLLCSSFAYAFPEQGNWTLEFSKVNRSHMISKTMFNNTSVNLDISRVCENKSSAKYEVSWLMMWVSCYGRLPDESDCFDDKKGRLDPGCICGFEIDALEFVSGEGTIDCEEHLYKRLSRTPIDSRKNVCVEVKSGNTTTGLPALTKSADKTMPTQKPLKNGTHPSGNQQRARRAAGEPNQMEKSTKSAKNVEGKTKSTVAPSSAAPAGANSGGEQEMAQSWRDGQYSLYIVIKRIQPVPEGEAKKPEANSFKVDIKTRDDRKGFLSAADFPYLYFYLVMTILYVFYGFFWLLMMACYWKDLLRIQYFIGLVIILGFIEKVFFYSEYEHVDRFGVSNDVMVIVAELVSVGKRTLARALVIVVSVGFGLVKPRLGPTLHKLLCMCFLYFILGAVESCLRATKGRQKNEDTESQSDLIATIPLALIETAIVYWVFSSLMETTRTLRLRRNVTKLSLYRHFTNLLIFCVLASVGYVIWFFVKVRFSECVRDIRNIWLGDGFWPMLFSVVLLVIMILWRPSINNQRYSHSLLMETEDGEEEEDTLMGTEAFEAKRRTLVNGRPSARDKRKSREEKVEDDLQWIEDNIPASVADSALQPVLNDSEEEIMTTRFELSKMD